MAKIVVPPVKYDTELHGSSVANVLKALGGEKITSGEGSVYRIPADKLSVLPDFNIRVRSGEYEEQVDDLVASIRSEGFLRTRPLTGFAAKDAEGTDVIYITDGHRRLEAVNRLTAEGVEIGPLPVIMAPANMTLEDHLVGLATSNSGNPLTMFEKALLAKRLENMGIDKPRIALRLNMTDRHLINMLKLSGAPTKIRNAIVDGKISATEALKQMKAKGADAGDAVERGIKTAEAKGKKKATARAMGDGESTTGEDEDTDKASVVTKNGKIHETIKVTFKQGQIVPADNMLAFARFKSGDWYNWVDKKSKKEAFIEYQISFTVSMVTKAEDVQTEEGEPEKANDALADETFENANGTETDGGAAEGEGGEVAAADRDFNVVDYSSGQGDGEQTLVTVDNDEL